MRRAMMPAIALSLAATALALADEPQAPALKEPAYRSAHPLYFRVAFESRDGRSMLGVLDEGDGTGKGYSLAYLDEKMNNDLTSVPPKRFPLIGNSPETQVLEPRFSFNGPFGKSGTAEYTLDLSFLALTGQALKPGADFNFFWFLKTERWDYMFINGQMRFYASAAEALKGKPVVLGGKCAWEIASRTEQDKKYVSAALKDENGCTLRIIHFLRSPAENPTPKLTLLKDGHKVLDQKMEFG